MDALPSGSYVAASHGSTEYGSQEEADVVLGIIEAGGVRIAPRSSHDFGHLVFDGLELVPPGVVLLPHWRRSRVAAPGRERGKSVPTQASPASRKPPRGRSGLTARAAERRVFCVCPESATARRCA